MADRRVPLTGTWSLWPVAALRSAGFPADLVLRASGERAGTFAEHEHAARALHEVAADDRLREALLWQNPKLVETVLLGYDAEAELRRKPADARYRRTVLLRYLQRYATKNDTVGFFGPVGWARLDPGQAAALTQKGVGAEVHRRSCFEPWAVEALAAAWETELRPHLRPVLSPAVRLDGATAVRPHRDPLPLSAAEAALARRCDGSTSAAELGADSPGVAAALDRLVAEDVLRWGLHVPFGQHMDAGLADLLATLPPSPARDRCQAELARLRRLRTEVDAAAGDVPRLRTALHALAEAFEQATRVSATVAKQDRPDSRGLLVADSLADWDVVLGGTALTALAEPLALVLDVCRWVTWRLAEGIGAKAVELVREHGGQVRFDRLLDLIRPETTGKPGCHFEQVIEELRAKVDRLIPLPEVRRLNLSATELRADWAREFAAPAPGWPSARMHNPDLMLACADPGGDFQWVLGEVHVAINPLDFPLFAGNQADPGTVERLLADTVTGPRHLPAFSRRWGRLTPRTYPARGTALPGDIRWTAASDDLLAPGDPRFRAVDLTVVEEDGTAVVCGPPGWPRAPFTHVIGEFLTLLAIGGFSPFRPRAHEPRVTVGKLVLHRETWRLPVADLLAGLPKRARPAALVDRLTRTGVPRFSFVRVPGEPKPVFCDLRGEPLVQYLARLLDGAADSGAAAVFTEMLPGFDDLWLTDATGGRRTAEFRFLAVDESEAAR
ncbi:hypothetical protein JOF53_000313 [Crossiella equi]|uniref:Lantibiotic dehydratase N-terminal domain-containing protein n=1 Tax=Crossiella equi TaxID=130796 RepID=A0ABS5A556_9PSEU|nr:lantibiotic dehydratase [Crossiella equi]MBP2471441.1 hypothetical protein [Crossiella equi]